MPTGFNDLRLLSLSEYFYPTPRVRVENPTPTVLRVGDLVKFLEGPATGKVGVVVVDRNGNYVDHEPYCSEDAIGVQAVEITQLAPELRSLLVKSGVVDTSEDALTETVTRWCDGPDKLEFLLRPEAEADSSTTER